MKYYPPLGAEDDNADYENCDPVNHKWENSMPDARGFGATQREIINAITAAGLEPTEDDNGQLAAAIQKMVQGCVRYQSLYQRLRTVENGIIKAEDEKIIGWAQAAAETTFSFDTSSCSKNAADDVITLELYLNMPTPVAIHWPAGIMWVENEVPDLSEAGLYLLTFRRIKSVWQGSLNAPFAVFSGS